MVPASVEAAGAVTNVSEVGNVIGTSDADVIRPTASTVNWPTLVAFP